ncbi:MAG: L,D-transpeptidase family protein, partial [Aquificae bacterium]|nr:L,D-transpeptidase family protein [Aquificota bacterium]
IKIDPDNPFLLYKVGKLSEKIGNILEVRNVYSSILEKEIIKGFPENIVYLPPNSYVLVVDKSLQTLFVYKTDFDKKIHLFNYYPATTGQKFGEKLKTGDRKTPRGIYFFNRFKSRTQLSNNPLYGEGAFVTDYPNLVDRLLKKNGYGIWLHGTDTKDRFLKPFQTKGCVVVENKKIKELKKIISVNQTPIIIEDKVKFVKDNSKLKNIILNKLYQWKESWEQKDVATFFSLYHRDFRTGKNLNITKRAFVKSKKYRILKKRKINVNIADLKILYMKDGYKDKDLVVTHFLQHYKGDSYQDFGIKKLYWIGEGKNFKIIGEEFIKLKQPKKDIPVLLVSNQKQSKQISINKTKPEKRKPKTKRKTRKTKKRYRWTVETFFKSWERAWERKDVKRYVSFYCYDFKWRKGNKKTWEEYKRRTILNKKFIKVDLDILSKRDKGRFIEVIAKQKYVSDKFKSSINKKFILKKVSYGYCIYREGAI